MNAQQLKLARKKIADLKKTYVRVFGTGDGNVILEDLSKFCFFERSTYSPDQGRRDHNEGARTVFLYIRAMMKMDTPLTTQAVTDTQKEDPNNVPT